MAQVAYEAGPCGYSLYRACEAAGIMALVAAPSVMSRLNCRIRREDRYAGKRGFRLAPAVYRGVHPLAGL